MKFDSEDRAKVLVTASISVVLYIQYRGLQQYQLDLLDGDDLLILEW